MTRSDYMTVDLPEPVTHQAGANQASYFTSQNLSKFVS